MQFYKLPYNFGYRTCSCYVYKKIQTVGVLDRSLPKDEKSNINILDKILTAEGKNLYKDAAQKSADGLISNLQTLNRFVSIKQIEADNLRHSGLGIFPPTLSWEQVKTLCNQNNVDGIMVLSFFDTDARIDYKTIPVEVKTPLGIVKTVETEASVFTLIKTGRRIYDPVNKAIADEYTINRGTVTSGRGINPLKAAEAIIGRKDAVLNTSFNIGKYHSLRTIPQYKRVSRIYYVRGSENFETDKRRAVAGNWDGAAELWEKEIDNTKTKTAGRAYYNMAIISEIN